MRLENIKFKTNVKKKMLLLEDWSIWGIALTLQKDAIIFNIVVIIIMNNLHFSCKIPCFSYLKEAKKIETYLTLQFKCKPFCTKIIGITDLHFSRLMREE